MRISGAQVCERHGEIEYRFRVDCPGFSDALWYRIESKFANLVADLSDAALAALLIPAMARGAAIHIDGAVSKRLYYNLAGPYQRLLQHVIPSLRAVGIYPGELRSNTQRACGVATGFSGGIDSYCVLADHHYSDAGFKLTHLLFNNVGSHGRGKKGAVLFQERHARAARVAERMGLPLVKLDSNTDAFYTDAIGFEQTHTPRNAAVALLLQGGLGRYLYASGHGYADTFVGEAKSTAYSDAVALPLLSTDVLDAVSAGAHYTRVEKTLRVAEVADSHDSLDVCMNPHRAGNCSACAKCLRTLLTLDIAGLLDRYSGVFDLAAYRRRRSYFIGTVLRSREPLLIEIAKFAKQRQFAVPTSSRLSGLSEGVKIPLRPARNLARALLGKLAIRLQGPS